MTMRMTTMTLPQHHWAGHSALCRPGRQGKTSSRCSPVLMHSISKQYTQDSSIIAIVIVVIIAIAIIVIITMLTLWLLVFLIAQPEECRFASSQLKTFNIVFDALYLHFCKSLLCSMFNEQTCTRFTRLSSSSSPCPKYL